MIDGKFTAKERAYLSSLPAVKSVSASHIRYSDCFRVEVMCRYNAGESPSAIFREAGLDPKLIGYKRVERCIARWKQQERDERRKRKGAMNPLSAGCRRRFIDRRTARGYARRGDE